MEAEIEKPFFKSNTQVGILKGHTGWITKISVSSEGSDLLVTSSRDKTVIIWRIYPQANEILGKMLKSLVGHNHFVSDCALSNDGGHLITSSWDKTIKLWDIKTGVTKRTFIGHTNDVTSVTFSYDNRQIISGSRDKSVRLWNTLAVQKFCFEENGHQDCISNVHTVPQDKSIFIISSGFDGMIKKWQLSPPYCIRTYSGHNVSINSSSVSPNFKSLVSGDKNGVVNVWNLEKDSFEKTIDFQGNVGAISFHPQHPLFAVAVGSVVYLQNLYSNINYQPIYPFDCVDLKTQPKVTSLCWNNSGIILYVGYNDNNIRIFCLEKYT